MFAVFTGKIKSISYAHYTMFKLGKCTAVHSHPILTASINTSSELILSPIFASMQLPQFWHHPHQWDMYGNWKIINCKLYGEHKNLHQRASLNVFTANCQKGCKTRRCSCYKSDLKCTELFRCKQNSDILADELSTVVGKRVRA